MSGFDAMRRLSSADAGFDAALAELTRYEAARDPALVDTVTAILADVRARGDAAVLEHTNRLDRMQARSMAELVIGRDELDAALASLPAVRREALTQAASRVRRFHEAQCEGHWSIRDEHGATLGQRILPLDRVGLYVPGGRAAYPSSVLMNAIPARVAGVGELVMVVPTPDGQRNSLVLAAAALAGVDRVIAVGGAQAVAALAYGSETVPAVDKIVGPGNAWVAEAKRQVFGVVGIDMIAGPSEILVLADGTVDPRWAAMDMFSQAEHDELAQAILLSPDADYLERVATAVAELLPGQPRESVIRRSLTDRGALIRVRDMAEACEIANRIAPEHLEILAVDAARWVDSIRHAGAVFVGPYASESLGDYCAGPNHVLPTMRTARFSSPLGVYDFQKRASLLEISPAAAAALGPVAGELADAEGLAAHAASARLRLDDPAVRAAAGGARDAKAVAEFAIGPAVRVMHAYPVAPANGLLKLDAMENPYELDSGLRRALAERLAALPINRYPVPSYSRLKGLIATTLGVPEGFPVVVGNGSDELISMLGLAVAGSGRPILAPQPSFVMYELGATLARCRFVGVPLHPDFSLDGEAMLAAIERERPALVYLAYPNNPTGNAFDDGLVERIVRASPGLVVIDEAYQPFAQRSWMPRLAQFPNLVVMRTVSKIGLAGIRIGYLAADPAIANELEKVRPPYNISVLDEAAAEFALEHHEVLADQARRLRESRDRMAADLAAIDGLSVTPSLANFVLARVGDADAVHRGLVERGILVRNVSRMHPLLANCLRLSVGTPDDCRRLVGALRDILSDPS
jgi:histidinol dehydrogenase